MGKILTIYLSDDEARDLKEFCDENRCTQYSVLKTAVKQLLYKSVQVEEEGLQEIIEEPEVTLEETEEESTTIVEDAPEGILETPKEETSTPVSRPSLREFLRKLESSP